MNNKDINYCILLIILLLNIIQIGNSQRDSSPTSVPTSQPTDYTENIYFDADIILIISLLLIFTAACMFGWLCLPFRVACLQCCIPGISLLQLKLLLQLNYYYN